MRDSKSYLKICGVISPSVPFRNSETGEYDLTYRAAAVIPDNDTLTSALVLKDQHTIFNITGDNGFVSTPSYAAGAAGTEIGITGGVFYNLTTLWTNNQTYLDIVDVMTSAPGTFIARITSENAPDGFTQGPFVATVFAGTRHRPSNMGPGRDFLLNGL